MNRLAFHKICLALITIGAVAAIWIMVERWKVEAGWRRVAILVDYREVELLALASGHDTKTVLAGFRAAGATGAALLEESLRSMLDSGEAVVTEASPSHVTFTLLVPPLVPPKRAQEVGRVLSAKTPAVYSVPGPPYRIISTNPTPELLETGVGLSHSKVDAIREAGMMPAARPSNDGFFTPASIGGTLDAYQDQGVNLIICEGTAVIGFPTYIPEAAGQIRKRGLVYCSVEMGKQFGDASLSRLTLGNLLRLHSITEKEMPAQTPQGAVERFVRAARERNIRVCYVHLLPSGGEQGLQDALSLVSNLRKGLEASGLSVGPAQPLGTEHRARLRFLFPVALGLWAGVALALSMSGAAAPALLLALTVAATLASWAGLYYLHSPSVLGLAFVAACTGPALATSAALRMSRPSATPALAGLAVATLISVAAGIFVAALLYDTKFLLKVSQFRGLKLAQIVPLVAVALMVLAGTPPAGETDRVSLWSRLRKGLEQRTQVWHLIVALLTLALLVVWIARTGSEATSAVSPLELKARALLERVLWVRPRSKEFLFAHPLLVAGLVYFSGRGFWPGLAVVLGSIGQISVVNTFCHLHTPISVSLVRTAHGLWLGAIAGLVLLAILRLVRAHPPPTPH